MDVVCTLPALRYYCGCPCASHSGLEQTGSMSCRPATFVSTNHQRGGSQVTSEDQWEGRMGTQVFRTCLVAYQEWLSNRREANRRRDEPLVSNRSFKLPTVACWCCRRQAWCNQEAPENPKGFQLRSSATDNSGLGANANRRRFLNCSHLLQELS